MKNIICIAVAIATIVTVVITNISMNEDAAEKAGVLSKAARCTSEESLKELLAAGEDTDILIECTLKAVEPIKDSYVGDCIYVEKTEEHQEYRINTKYVDDGNGRGHYKQEKDYYWKTIKNDKETSDVMIYSEKVNVSDIKINKKYKTECVSYDFRNNYCYIKDNISGCIAGRLKNNKLTKMEFKEGMNAEQAINNISDNTKGKVLVITLELILAVVFIFAIYEWF